MAAFTIATSVSTGGVIDPSVVVWEGSSVTILYRGEPGYSLARLLVDGSAVDVSTYLNAYTFEEIDSNHVISAIYEESSYNCTSLEDECVVCSELANTSADLLVNGVSDNIAASLQNDTGLNPSDNHADGYDLNLMNDCLVGRYTDNIEAIEVCNLKDFLSGFISNVYNVIKAMICAICGLWANVHTLAEQSEQSWNYIDNMREDIHGISSEVEITLLSTDWSDSTVSINTVPYYYAEVSLAAIYSEHPIISLGAENTIPTGQEILDYSAIEAAVADLSTNTITLYAQTAPTGDLVLIIKEAE